MRSRALSNRVDDLDSIERKVGKVLVPVEAPPGFARHLRSGLLASVPAQGSIVLARSHHSWGVFLALVGGLVTSLWLLLYLLLRDRSRAAG